MEMLMFGQNWKQSWCSGNNQSKNPIKGCILSWSKQLLCYPSCIHAMPVIKVIREHFVGLMKSFQLFCWPCFERHVLQLSCNCEEWQHLHQVVWFGRRFDLRWSMAQFMFQESCIHCGVCLETFNLVICHFCTAPKAAGLLSCLQMKIVSFRMKPKWMQCLREVPDHGPLSAEMNDASEGKIGMPVVQNVVLLGMTLSQRQLVLCHPEQNVFQALLGGQNVQPLSHTGAWSWVLSSETFFAACEEMPYQWHRSACTSLRAHLLVLVISMTERSELTAFFVFTEAIGSQAFSLCMISWSVMVSVCFVLSAHSPTCMTLRNTMLIPSIHHWWWLIHTEC